MSARPIQIWQPVGDRWVRPPPGPFGDHHSAVEVLHPKPPDGSDRVVLVGESVAAGYLYAPDYTPAQLLAAALPEHDVVDLARTNESLASLVQTVDEAVQLEPDVVVMWAGNNWMLRDLGALSPYHPEATQRTELAEALAAGGPGAAAAMARGASAAYVGPLLDRLGALVRAAGARLVVVVPEVSLVDWDHRQPVTWLPDGGVGDWYRTWETHRADPTAPPDRMLELDRGSCATTHRLVGRTLEGEAQLDWYRREVAAAAGPLRASATAPMATIDVQDLLRRWATRCRFDVVDVGALITAAGDRPDRRWFLDYCHHTSLGMRTVVRAVAAKVAEQAAGPPPAPAPATEAAAALGALVHTGHRLVSSHDRRELMGYWRDRAVDGWDGAPRVIADVLASRTSGGPTVLNPATMRLAAGPGRMGFAHGIRPLGVVPDVLAALGASAAELAGLALAPERAWPYDQTWEPAEHLWTDAHPGGAEGHPSYHRSIWPTSTFAVGTADGFPSRIRVTARCAHSGPATVELGPWRTSISLTPSWATVDLDVPAAATAPGLHPLRVRWPPIPHGAEGWERALAALRADEPAELHPVFGEVHSIVVT